MAKTNKTTETVKDVTEFIHSFVDNELKKEDMTLPGFSWKGGKEASEIGRRKTVTEAIMAPLLWCKRLC